MNACQLIVTTFNRGVPVMGLLLFNIFLDDLFYVKMNCEIANYADDNHLYYAHHCDKTFKLTKNQPSTD